MNTLAINESPQRAEPVRTPVPGRNLLQRKCACGGTPGPDGECAACRQKRLALRRRPANGAAPATAPPIVGEVLRSPGRPLDAATRASIEPPFGHDFGEVRVHDDGRAAESARAVGARAYTVGQNVVFGTGRYAPGTVAGRELLAHELVHTIQQGRATSASWEGLILGSPGDAAEQQADRIARSVSQGSPAPVAPAVSTSGPRLARQPVGGKEESGPTSSETAQVEDRAKKQREGEKKVEGDLKAARGAHARATAMLDAVAAGDLDVDLVDQVRAQGESALETIELLAESGSILASLTEDARKTVMGAGAVELQVYIHSVGHLIVLEKIVSFEIPEAVTNQDEVEAKLDEYANWHEEWIGANEGIGELAADLVDFGLGLEEKIEMNVLVGQDFAKTEEQGQGLKEVDEHVALIVAEAKSIQRKADARSTIETIVEVIQTVRGRRRGPRRPPRVKGGSGTKAPKRSAKQRKQFKAPKGKTKKPKERKKKKERKRKERAKAYPICWATQLGPPLLGGAPVPFFVRTPGVERDTDDARQRRMQLWYREFVDPDFRSAGYHVHHIIPLFLGGPDATSANLTVIPARLHLRGHAVLAKQPQMARPPSGLPPLPENMYSHPAGTRYRLRGFKTEANQTC